MRNTHINLHFPVQSIVHDKTMTHSNAMWFHGMTWSVVVIADIGCIVYAS